MTWGHPKGGDSSRVQNQLRNVQQICGTGGAFAAILADGSVVTWGHSDCGGSAGSKYIRFWPVRFPGSEAVPAASCRVKEEVQLFACVSDEPSKETSHPQLVSRPSWKSQTGCTRISLSWWYH